MNGRRNGRREDILLVGGYGVVGKRIAAHLRSTFPDRVIVAGRDLRRAEMLCRELGHGTRPRQLDVTDAATIGPALEGVGTVMACVAQHESHLLRAAIERGLGYTELAPRHALAGGTKDLGTRAQATGARVVLGAGLSPGISNLMARRLLAILGGVEHIETAILLSLGDEYGPDSLRHMLESLAHPFSVMRDGRRMEVLAFSEPRRVEFPPPLGSRTAYLFPWSDALYYPETLGARSASGRFALQPAWAGPLIAALLRGRAGRWLSRSRLTQGKTGIIHQMRRLCAGQDDFALVVTATAAGRSMRMSLAGRRQASATAAGAVEIVRALADGGVSQPGVWLPEEVIPQARFFHALSRLGLHPEMRELHGAQRPDAPSSVRWEQARL